MEPTCEYLSTIMIVFHLSRDQLIRSERMEAQEAVRRHLPGCSFCQAELGSHGITWECARTRLLLRLSSDGLSTDETLWLCAHIAEGLPDCTCMDDGLKPLLRQQMSAIGIDEDPEDLLSEAY